MSSMLTKVAVSGAFDPLHAGHVRYIREASMLGDWLVVILNTDDFLLRKKGFIFLPFKDRKEILGNIKGVDEVIASVDEDQTVCQTLQLVRPDVFAKGGNFMETTDIPEVETCRKIGCKLITNVGGSLVRSAGALSWRVKEMGLEDMGKLRITCPYCDDHPILKKRCLYCKGTGKIAVERAG